jgi:hypothetical protein
MISMSVSPRSRAQNRGEVCLDSAEQISAPRVAPRCPGRFPQLAGNGRIDEPGPRKYHDGQPGNERLGQARRSVPLMGKFPETRHPRNFCANLVSPCRGISTHAGHVECRRRQFDGRSRAQRAAKLDRGRMARLFALAVPRAADSANDPVE